MKKHRSQSPASKLVLRKEVVVVLREDLRQVAGGAIARETEPGTSVVWGCTPNLKIR